MTVWWVGANTSLILKMHIGCIGCIGCIGHIGCTLGASVDTEYWGSPKTRNKTTVHWTKKNS